MATPARDAAAEAARGSARAPRPRRRSVVDARRRARSTRSQKGAREGARFLASLVTGTTGWDGFADCDLVIEAVFEELSVKQRGASRTLEPVVPRGLRARDEHLVALAGGDGVGARQPERFVGIHFFNPVAVMPLVELVRRRAHRRRGARDRGRRRPQAAQDAACRRATRPGFVVNRMFDADELRAHARRSTTARRSTRPTRRCCGSACRWRRRCSCRWSGRGSRTTCCTRCTPPIPSASRLSADARRARRRRRRAGRRRASAPSTRRRGAGRGAGGARRRGRRILDEGVVAEAADIDTCLILGAGWPFWLGGITKYLDQTGVSRAGRRRELGRGNARTDPRAWHATTGGSGSSFPRRRRAARPAPRGLGTEARELAEELEEQRLAVTHDEDSVFVYAASLRAGRAGAGGARGGAARAAARAGARRRRALARRRGALGRRARPAPDAEDETLARGYAPWEVRVDCALGRRGAASSPSGSKPRATVSSATGATCSPARPRARRPTRWRSASTARSSPAASSSGRSRREIRSRSSSAASAASGAAIRRRELGYARACATLAADPSAAARPLSWEQQHGHVCCAHARDRSSNTIAPEAADVLTDAAASAPAWAGEPFLHDGRGPGGVLAPGTARRARARRGARRDRGRAEGAVDAVEGALRADARARARAQPRSRRTSPTAPSCAATRSTRSPGC